MKTQRKHIKPSVKTINMAAAPVSSYIVISDKVTNNINKWWLWGSDNLLPNAIAYMNRRGTVQRALLNSKTTYCSGKKFLTENKELADYIKKVNLENESLHKVYQQLLFDKFSQGNYFTEIVTDKKNSFYYIYRHDPLNCRVGKKEANGYILVHSKWDSILNTQSQIKKLRQYPNFEEDNNGLLRSMYHAKELDQGYQHYGLPSFIAGLQSSAIAYKTDKWNLSRIDNSFNSSAIITVEDEFESDKDAEKMRDGILETFSGEGTAGKIVVIAKGINDGTTTVEQLSNSNDGDWQNLHSQSKDDLVIAHEWYRSLVSFPDNTGFDTKRILNEYQIAQNTIISKVQEEFIELFKMILGNRYDLDDLAIENKPPVNMMAMLNVNEFVTKGEARKMAGLEVDETDPRNNEYISQGSTKINING